MIWFRVSINDGEGYMAVTADRREFVAYYDLDGNVIQATTTVTALTGEVDPPEWAPADPEPQP